MITLVKGGADCGKSAFAEQLAMESIYKKRYYIATMQVVDEESLKRRERHRELRRDKGFETLEIPSHIEEAPSLMEAPEKCCVLLECAANLVANIMHEDDNMVRHDDEGDDGCEAFVSRVTGLIGSLSKQVGDMIIVTSEYSFDQNMDKETHRYIELLNRVNNELISMADLTYDMGSMSS